MESKTELDTQKCTQSICNNYEALISELLKLPKELKSLDFILPKLIKDYKELQEEMIYKYSGKNQGQNYSAFLSVTFLERKEWLIR